jgi:hypothetical protein
MAITADIITGQLKAIAPAAISSFVGTVSSSGATVTFSSAADAVKAGYSATSPVLGTKVIAAGLTRFILSWTNATTCTVDSAPNPAWSTTAITSVQGPQIFSTTSDGVLSWFIGPTGIMYQAINVGIGTTVASAGKCVIQSATNDGSTTPLVIQNSDGAIIATIHSMGGLTAGIARVEVPATGSLTAMQVRGTVVSNYGQTVANTQTLPTLTGEMNGIVQIETSGMGAFYLKAGPTDRIGISIGGIITWLADGNKVGFATPAVGNSFAFKTIRVGASAYDMIVYPNEGTLVDGGA